MRAAPDFDLFRDTILRRGQRDRVPLVELGVHWSHMDAAREHFGGLRPLGEAGWTDPARKLPAVVEFWHQAGYDYVRPALPLGFAIDRSTIRGADVSDGSVREWANELDGDIRDRESLESYPWPTLDAVDLTELEYCRAHMPPGMGFLVAIGGGPFEWATRLMGLTGFCMALYQDPDFVREVLRRIGEHTLAAVEKALSRFEIDAFIIGDDMGFRTSTLIPPAALREFVLPWHQRLADLVHGRGALYLLHCCGEVSAVMDDLIDTVKIDGKHSYEDTITPVWEAKRRWGDRVAILGGVDMDIMTRADEATCRARVRDILARCAPGGGYALGTGNTVANYVRRENYLGMLEEGRAWVNR
jgi:uroporphyrinogen decarboxylase